MKKNIFVPLFFFMMLFTSCNPSNVAYKEFPYLPAYAHMTIENFQKATDEEGLHHATFTVQNVDYENFLADYEKILHKNGWRTTDDKKPFSMNLKKDDHILIMVLTSKKTDKNISGIIYSK